MSDKAKRVLKGPPYKDNKNAWATRMLFCDLPDNRHTVAADGPFTLMEKRPGKICAKDTFIEMGDPTGYSWATKYLKSYQHWEHLMTITWFREAYNIWMRELHAKMRGEALSNIRDISQDPEASDSQRLNASKYLAERPYEQADIKKQQGEKRGRPSKAEVSGKLKELAELDQDTREEFERVGLRLVKD